MTDSLWLWKEPEERDDEVNAQVRLEVGVRLTAAHRRQRIDVQRRVRRRGEIHGQGRRRREDLELMFFLIEAVDSLFFLSHIGLELMFAFYKEIPERVLHEIVRNSDGLGFFFMLMRLTAY